jgi:CheY-like chemotaxis protein
MPVGKVSKRIRGVLARQVKGAADVVGATVEVTRDITSSTLRSVKGRKAETPRVAGDTIEGAVKAGSEAGMDLGAIAKGAVIGVVQGVGDVTRVTAGTISDAAAAAVRVAGEVGGDVALVARKAVEGAIEAGKEANLKAEEAASAGAAGALSAAAELGEAVAGVVAKALSGTISGVRVVIERPFRKPEILLASANRRDLEQLGQQLGNEGYRVHTAASRRELDRILLASEGKISLALIDVSDFDQEIWGNCEQLRKARIPFLIITAKRSPTIQRDSVDCGASGVLLKPIGVKELVEHMHGLLGD